MFYMREEHRPRMCENALTKMHGPQKYEGTGEWRTLHNEELCDLYCSQYVNWVMKSRRMRRRGHVTRVGRREVDTGFLWGKLREGDHTEDPGIDRRIILKWIFKKRDGGAWTGLTWLRIGRGGEIL
jgi:hypothetical protein